MAKKRSKRPPEKWFKSCKRKVKGSNKYAVCQAIWNRISTRRKKRIRQRGELF